MTIIRNFKHLFSSLLLAAAVALPSLPARAQLDPRLQTTKTDFLDLFQQSAALAVKPEMLTIFDFSGSMHAVYWDPRYYANANQSNHADKWKLGTNDWFGIVPVLDEFGQVYLHEGTGYFTHDTGRLPVGVDNTGTGRLIQPDGTVVPLSGGSYTQDELTALVKLASHVRISATTLIGGVSVTRTVDLPIPWVIMDQTVPILPTPASSTITYLNDPSGFGPPIEPDWLYKSTTQNNIVNNPVGSYYKIGRFHYNFDFLWWVFFGMDTRNATNNGSNPGTKFVIPAFATTNATLEPAGYPATTWNNKLQGFTRFQALKYAVIKTWFDKQDKVWWAYRFLDGAEERSTSLNTDNGPLMASMVTKGRHLQLFRCAPDTSTQDESILYFVKQEPKTSTPLTYAFANAYAQMIALPQTRSIFQEGSSTGTQCGPGQVGTEIPIPTCRTSFLVAFTDGQANDGLFSSGSGDAIGTASDVYGLNPTEAGGNAALDLSGGLNSLVPGTSGRFNIWTLAAVAAHYPPPAGWVPPPSVGLYSVPRLAPFNVNSRGATPTSMRKIRTMSVAMSVAGSTLDATSGKADLFRAALYGKPATLTWDKTAKPFDPGDPTANDRKVNPFFFDATDVNKLVVAIKAIVGEVISSPVVVSTPVVPFVGLGLANQIYLGSFLTPKDPGPIWSGDLQMFATITNPDQSTSLVDASLNPITTPDASNAQWTAAGIFTSSGANRQWHQRKAWTRIPASGTGATANPGLIPFTDVGTSATNPVFPYFATALLTDAAKQTLIQTLLGAKPGVGGTRTSIPNNVTVLGDIVDSTPNVAEYDLNDATIKAGLAAASPYLSGKLPSPITPNVHFRLIFVGDNLGFLHAFGEVSQNIPSIPSDPSSKKVTTGWVDELWTYYPTDFLQNADYNLNSANPHRFAVDGSPFVYHLDLPKLGDIKGDKKINNGERALVICGLRKGGRSYYALDIRDPFTPKLGPYGTNASPSNLGWALVPDEAAVFDATRIETGQSAATVTAVLNNMGFSSATPAVGRVIYGSTPKLRDVVFLGGGYSVPEIEVNFANQLLGRSTLALDVLNGNVLGLWDLSATAGMGPVSAGVVPFEFFPNSGLVQRAYFTDFWGGLWALGSAQLQVTTAAPNFGGFRLDSSALDRWTSDGSRNPGLLAVRKIYSLPKNNSLASSLPAPFSTANFPITRDTDPKVTPAVVGIAMVSGDRNNLLDVAYNTTTNIKPTQHRLTVIWDRQDSQLLGLDPGGIDDSRLVDLTGQSTVGSPIIDPSNASYYLKASNPTDKVGYFVNFPAALAPFVSKGISQPIVLSYVLIYSYFSPTKYDPCTGGTGNSLANRVCNVVLPVITNAKVSAVSTACTSGNVLSWIGIASEFSAKNNIAALQGGNVISKVPPPAGQPPTTMVSIQTITGNQSGRFPKPRVWRVVR